MAFGPARRSSLCLLGKAQNWHKVCQVWCTMEFLLISSKTDKETLADVSVSADTVIHPGPVTLSP